jgi:hypothetical protein
MNTVFIHTNDKQHFGALISKYSIEKNHPHRNFDVRILNMEMDPDIGKLFGNEIVSGGRKIKYMPDDLQSFTLSRFMPPALMGYKGKSIVIDPDVFCVQPGLDFLFKKSISNCAIGAVKRGNYFLSSVMLLDNERLKHWEITSIVDSLLFQREDYRYYMNLDFEKDNIFEIPGVYNSLDKLDHDTILLHNTNRLTQPWKTGLNIDFIPTPMKKIFGLIPREWAHNMLGKSPKYYLRHPDMAQVNFFIGLCRDAVNDGFLTIDLINDEIQKGNVRTDLLELIECV